MSMGMDSLSYDSWKTTPPEEPSSCCKCCMCDNELFAEEDYYEIDGDIYCEDCFDDWADEHKHTVTHSMMTGGYDEE